MHTIKMTTISLIMAGALFAAPDTAIAGNTAETMETAGYFCFAAGPDSWIHCLRAEKLGNPAVPVKVFSVDGQQFLGTEELLRYDIYWGQPCPQDGASTWDWLGDPPYFACHHFHTGHHD